MSSANIAFGTVNAFKNLKLTLDSTESDNLKKTAKPMLSNIVQNHSESFIASLIMFSIRRNAMCCGRTIWNRVIPWYIHLMFLSAKSGSDN